MSTFQKNLLAGESVIWPGGEQFLLIEASDPVTVEFRGPQDKTVEVWTDIKAGLVHELRNGPFLSVKVTNGLVAQLVRVQVTEGRANYLRLPGDVNVLTLPGVNISTDEAWRSHADGGRAFVGGVNRAGQAALYTTLQLRNPVGSGVDAYVVRGYFWAEVGASPLAISDNGAAMGSDAGTPGRCNKLWGGSNPVCELRYGNLGAPLPGTHLFNSVEVYADAAGNQHFKFPKKDPVKLAPGHGLQYHSGSAQKTLYMQLEWIEIPV